jgi:hypothetical protein
VSLAARIIDTSPAVVIGDRMRMNLPEPRADAAAVFGTD